MPPKLARSSKKSKPAAGPAGSGGTTKQSNPMLLLGIGLAVAAFVLFYALASGAAKKADVLVAKGSIPPFATIRDSQLETRSVPADSITSNDLTPEEFKAKQAQGKALISRVEILPGQRVDTGAVSAASLGSLASVRPDERVVAMPASFPGAAAGVAVPGSVVDVYRAENGSVASSDSNGNSNGSVNLVVENAKVLAVGVGPETAANVRPESKLKADNNSSGGSVVVVLAVPSDKAGAVVTAGQVYLALDPHYSFTQSGKVCKIEECAKLGGQATPENPAQVDPTNPDDPASLTQDPTSSTAPETQTIPARTATTTEGG